MTSEHRRWVHEALARADETTPKETAARLLSWHAGDVKDIDDPSDYVDAMRAADLHAQLGDPFGRGQAPLRAGSARLSTADGTAALEQAYALLVPFCATKALARCLSAMASSCLLSGDLTKAKRFHEEALAITRRIES